jgi:hypothetical protein
MFYKRKVEISFCIKEHTERNSHFHTFNKSIVCKCLLTRMAVQISILLAHTDVSIHTYREFHMAEYQVQSETVVKTAIILLVIRKGRLTS